MVISSKFFRHLDDTGRIVIPSEILKELGLNKTKRPEFEIIAVEDGVLLKKRKLDNICQCCGENTMEVVSVGRTTLCHECIKKFSLYADSDKENTAYNKEFGDDSDFDRALSDSEEKLDDWYSDLD